MCKACKGQIPTPVVRLLLNTVVIVVVVVQNDGGKMPDCDWRILGQADETERIDKRLQNRTL